MILPDRVFGRPGAHWMRSGVAIGADLLAHPLHQFLAQPSLGSIAGFQRYIGVDALAFDVVRIADDRRFRDLRMRDQRALDFGRAESVAGDIDARRPRAR